MKRLIAKGIIIGLIASSLNGVVFAKSKPDTNLFLEKIATTQDKENKELGIKLLNIYIGGDNPDVDGFKEIIEKKAPEQYKKKFEENGYNLKDTLDSLDVIKKMNKEDRQNLISAMEKSNLQQMKNIVNKYSKEETTKPEDNTNTPSTSIPSTNEPITNVVTENNKNVFKDLQNHWAKNDIEFLVNKGIIKGQDKDSFNPNGNITRAEFTALIVRMLDLKDKGTTFSEFKDINTNDWFYNFVKIGKQYEIITGVDKENFAPNKQVTREEMVSIIIRAMKDKTLKSTQTTNISIENYKDNKVVSSWAVENINKALNVGIIKGKNEEMFDANGVATRAEAATMIKRVFDLIN